MAEEEARPRQLAAQDQVAPGSNSSSSCLMREQELPGFLKLEASDEPPPPYSHLLPAASVF